jgi:hypothetical protein
MSARSRKVQDLLADMLRAYDFVQGRRQLAEAVAIYRDVLAETRALGLESAQLLWAMAVAFDCSGELEMAFDHVTQAVAKDPLAPPFRRSFELVAGHLRAALADPARADDDPSTPRLYEMLVRADEADVDAHLAMARWHARAGHADAALRLLGAVTALHPASRDAWLLEAKLARETGDTAHADRAEIEAAALRLEPLPFAVPGVAHG